MSDAVANNTPVSLDALEQRQQSLIQLSNDTVDELLKFYVPRRRSFRPALLRAPSSLNSRAFNTASIMVVSAILNALREFPRIRDRNRLKRITHLCDDTVVRCLEPRYAYLATSSEAFGDLNPFASSLLLREALRRPHLLDDPPLTFRLATRIVLAYLRTQFSFDSARMTLLFGARSMWSLPENHPMVQFRCVDAVAELLAFLINHSPGDKWVRSCFGHFSNSDLRTILASASQGQRARVRQCLKWLGTDSLKTYQSALTREHLAKETISSFLEDLSTWALIALDLEIAKQHRKTSAEFDPSALAGLMAMIAVASPSVARVRLFEDLQLLLSELDTRGTWPVGRPFFYDETGGAYHSVSVEIGYVILRAVGALDRAQPRLSMNRVYDSLNEQLYTVHRWIEANRRTLTVADDAALYSPDNAPIRQCRGWANDRSPGVDRIDSWMGAVVLDFLCEDFALRKNYIQRLVLNQYEVMPYESCEPAWSEFVDPDLGTTDSIKKRIELQCLTPLASQPSVSILLYGPPGTSKTTIVRSLARERKADLVQLNAGDFVADGFELLENRARRIFADLCRLEAVVVLFDEMDPLIRGRKSRLKDLGATISDYVVPGMLPKLQDFHDHCVRSNMIFVITTNFRDTVDRAASRSGRIDLECLVLPYTRRGRIEQLTRFLTDSLGPDILRHARWSAFIGGLADQSALMVYRDLQQLARAVSEAYYRTARRILTATVTDENVKHALGVRSIRLEEYSREERPDSGPEFLCVLHRLLGLKLPRREVLDDDEQLHRSFRRLKSRLTEATDDSELLGRAASVLAAWC